MSFNINGMHSSDSGTQSIGQLTLMETSKCCVSCKQIEMSCDFLDLRFKFSMFSYVGRTSRALHSTIIFKKK